MIKKVYGNGLLIEPSVEAPIEGGGYIIPQKEDDAEVLILQGIVKYKGDAKDTEVGDLVVFDQFEHRKIMLGDVQYVYVKSEKELICKLEN